MTPTALLAALRVVVREEIARALGRGRIGAASRAVATKGGHGCDDAEREFSGRTRTDHSGRSSSLERMADDDIASLMTDETQTSTSPTPRARSRRRTSQ